MNDIGFIVDHAHKSPISTCNINQLIIYYNNTWNAHNVHRLGFKLVLHFAGNMLFIQYTYIIHIELNCDE